MTAAWASDSLDIKSNQSYTYVIISTFTHMNFFTDVYEKLDAQYKVEQAATPASMEAMEEVYLSALQKR